MDDFVGERMRGGMELRKMMEVDVKTGGGGRNSVRIILYYIVLRYITVYCFILYCVILYCIICGIFRIIVYYGMPHYAILYYTMLQYSIYYTVRCYLVLFFLRSCVILYIIMYRYITLGNIILRYNILYYITRIML